MGQWKDRTQGQRQSSGNLLHMKEFVLSCEMRAAHVDHVPSGELREGEAAVGRRLLRRRPLPREQRFPVARRKELEVVRGVRVDAWFTSALCQHPAGLRYQIISFLSVCGCFGHACCTAWFL